MRFEIGKYYKHTTGETLHVIAGGKTTLYGWTLIAEKSGDCGVEIFGAVGGDEDSAVNYTKITEEEWLKSFTE